MKLYKIGELAEISKLSTRTIDYYSKIGLIQPVGRSNTNYRLYNDETILRLQRIEILKREKYSLEEIKEMLDLWSKVTGDEQVVEKLTSLEVHIQQLEREIKEMQPILQQLKPRQVQNAFKRLAPSTAACIEALIFLFGDNSMM